MRLPLLGRLPQHEKIGPGICVPGCPGDQAEQLVEVRPGDQRKYNIGFEVHECLLFPDASEFADKADQDSIGGSK